MVALIAAVVLVPFTATAAPIDDARAQIWVIVNQADAHNQHILNDFAVAATGATTVEELDAAYATGYGALEARWYQANAYIDDIVEDFPELQGEASIAKAQLLDDHNGAHFEMDALYDLVHGSLGSTTTTTSTSTTTTVPPTTSTSTSTSTTSTSTSTTTTVARSTTTTTRPDTTTTTTTTTERPGPITTTVAPTTTSTSTTTTTAAIGIGTPGSGNGTGTGSDGSPTVGNDPAATGQLTFADDGTVMSETVTAAMSDMRYDNAPAMAVIVDRASIVLPPGLVEMAARPLVAVEYIARAFFDSVGSMVIPFVTLMAAVAWMLWRESRRTRAATT